ncbi:MAG: AI-2E family transporter [Clostridia bacterium]|nr:MAG: AI-2E family transporter [Clostridia bacterium]
MKACRPAAGWVKLLLVTAAILAVLLFLYQVRQVLLAFLLAAALAYLLDPWVDYLQRLGLGRTWAILSLYVAGLGTLLVFAFYAVPGLQREVQALASSLPGYTRELEAVLDTYHRAELPATLTAVVQQVEDRLEAVVITSARQFAAALVGIVSQLVNIVLVPVIAFYFLRDKELIARYLVRSLPSSWREDLVPLGASINRILLGFVQGRLLVAVIVSALTALGLAIINMDFALILGLLAGVAEIIPYFGPLLGAIPALLLALPQGGYMPLYVAAVLVAVQQLESNLIAPKILGDSVGLHPLVVIFALLAGGYLWGVVGLVVAVPLAGVIRILLAYLWDKLPSRLKPVP